MADNDVPEVADLERRCFPTPWSAAAFRHELQSNPFSRSVVARDTTGRLAAYACAWVVADELQINTLAVEPDRRRQGLGRRVLEEVLRSGMREGCRLAMLEVRPSNGAALALYRGLGFRPVAVRRGYYADGEDALLLRLRMRPRPGSADP